jgi:predicted TIM-barrel fold metal-dependent hydrolase
MLSRREALKGAAVAGATAIFGAPGRAILAKAAQPSTPVSFAVPDGACDCHVHIFGDPQKYPFIATRSYTPESASIGELNALHRALKTTRVVVVHPSVYGADNSCSLDAMRALGPSARGVSMVDEHTTDAAIAAMHAAGMRGIRVNLETAGLTDPAAAKQRFDFAVSRAKPHNWHIQIYTRPSVILGLRSTLEASPVPVVFDHFGGAQAADGLRQPGLDALTALLASGKAYVKISGAYRGSTAAPDYADMAPLAKAFIAANPQRVLWGSDWPHPDTTPNGRKPTDIFALLPIDDGRVFNQLPVWAPDAATRKMILVDNPARLYGF